MEITEASTTNTRLSRRDFPRDRRRVAKATPEDIKVNRTKRYVKWQQKLNEDLCRKAEHLAMRRRRYQARKNEHEVQGKLHDNCKPILTKLLPNNKQDISQWSLVTVSTTWYIREQNGDLRIALCYKPHYFKHLHVTY